ncbi:hypothetical protein BH10BDE1_BH10BDE1_15420 [soil metagenome]
MKASTFAKMASSALVAVIGLALPSFANAAGGGTSGGGFMIGASIMQLNTKTDGPNIGDNDTSTTLLNGKAGYTMSNGLYIGGVYDSRTDETNGSKTERSGYGATVGYHNMGWFIDGSYYLSSTYKLSGGTELSGGTGFGVDVGHNFDILSNVYLGLQLSYKSFTYTKIPTGDATNKVTSETVPLLNIGVMF